MIDGTGLVKPEFQDQAYYWDRGSKAALIVVGSAYGGVWAVKYFGGKAVLTFIAEEAAESAFESATGIPVIVDPKDLGEALLKRGVKKELADQAQETVERQLREQSAKSASDCPPDVKEIIIDGSKHPESAQHAQDAIDAGISPNGIVDRSNAKPRRKERLKDEPVVPGKDRDEFPPAVLDNGSGGHSVRPIPPGDNRGAGSSIGHQLDGVPNGTPVVVKPINVPPKKKQ
jgi:hypothetical protein